MHICNFMNRIYG